MNSCTVRPTRRSYSTTCCSEPSNTTCADHPSAKIASRQAPRRSADQAVRSGPLAKQPVRPGVATATVFLANGLGMGHKGRHLAGATATARPVKPDAVCRACWLRGGAVASMLMAARLAGRFGVDRMAVAAALAFAIALVLPPGFEFAPLACAALVLGLSSRFRDVCINANATTVEQAWSAPLMSSFHASLRLGGMLAPSQSASCSASLLVSPAAWGCRRRHRDSDGHDSRGRLATWFSRERAGDRGSAAAMA